MSRPESAEDTTTGGWGLPKCCCVYVWSVWGVSLMVFQSFKISEFNVSTIFYSYYLFVYCVSVGMLQCTCGVRSTLRIRFSPFTLFLRQAPPCPPYLPPPPRSLSLSHSVCLLPVFLVLSSFFFKFFPHTLYPDQSFRFLCFSKHLHLPCPPDLLLHVPSEKSRFPRAVN